MIQHDLPQLRTSIGRDLAQMALAREIQEIFNLVPKVLAGEVLESANKLRRDPVRHAQEVKCDALCVFAAIFGEIAKVIDRVNHTLFEPQESTFNHPLAKHFRLYPRRIAKAIVQRAKETGWPPSEVARYYEKNIPEVVRFSFNEVIELLEKDLQFAKRAS